MRTAAECNCCWGGRYCSQSGLAAPDGECDAGYFCEECAFTAAPQDGTTGDICTRGGFCEQTTKIPYNCRPGTYNPQEGSTSNADCIACP